MKLKSVATRNITILILSLMPFIVGISISIANSSAMAYFGQAINISGSQRMRTMLLANYAQQYEDAIESGNLEHAGEIKGLLNNELEVYEKFMAALIEGDETIDMIGNDYEDVVVEIENLYPLFEKYTQSVRDILTDPDDLEKLEFIKSNSLPLKNYIHEVVERYQRHYDENVKRQKTIDISMITIAVLVTASGLFLTRIIKKHEYLANYDYLTGLQNRNSLYAYIKDKKTKDYNVFFMDLNKFKVINDTFGHAIGDEVLIEVSNRLKNVFGAEAVFRFGGDEFVVLNHVVEDNLRQIENLTVCVKRELTNPIIDTHKRHHYVGISMGIASYRVDIKDWDKLINFADELMYDSKSFTGHIVMCNEAIDADSKLNLSLELERAFEKKEIQPHFQTVYRSETGQKAIYTAVSRWHRRDSIIHASAFLPIAKRKGLLFKLDKYMIKAIDDLYQSIPIDSSLKEKLFIVNISEETLLNANSNGLFEFIGLLKMPKKQMGFKFLEYVLLDENIFDVIEKLAKLGFTLIVDNFTIDISLKESEKFENVDIVQLGKVTVDALMVDDYSRKTLKEFIKMLISIDKKVIIEGLKDDYEINLLKELMGDLGGDLYYTPKFELKTLKEIKKTKNT